MPVDVVMGILTVIAGIAIIFFRKRLAASAMAANSVLLPKRQSNDSVHDMKARLYVVSNLIVGILFVLLGASIASEVWYRLNDPSSGSVVVYIFVALYVLACIFVVSVVITRLIRERRDRRG